jgi:hypothetical protein
MSVRNAIVLLLALSTLTLLVACGGSSSPTPVPPPSGGFSASSLNGTYVFSSTGVDATNGLFLTIVGSLAANGSGGITGGSVDLLGASLTPTTPIAQPITGGTYTVSADGRGQINFNTTASTGAVTLTLDFALTSSSHGLVTEFDANGTGSGTIDLQGTISQSQFAASYAFGLSGTGTTGTSPISTEGAFTLDSNGDVTTGQEDVNNAASYTGTTSILTTSAVNVATTPGTATIISSGGTNYTFDVYPIDNTHMKFVENDSQLLVSGDAYTQGTSIAAGQLVFTLAGENDSSGTPAPLDSGGWLTNASGTISTGLEDWNDAGAVGTATTVSGGFSTLTGGRSVLSLSGFVNGAASDVPGNYAFAAYPFTYSGGSGIQLLEIDGLGITSGAAYPQTSTTLAATQGYGLNLTGVNSGGEEDDIAEFVTTSSGFSGIVDLNDEGTLSFDKALTGSYTAPDGNGRGSATTTNYFNFNFYVVNSSTYLLLESDASQVGLGTFQQQSTPSSAAVQSPVSMLRPAFRAHASRLKKKE